MADLANVADRTESNADDREEGLPLLATENSFLWRALLAVVFALRKDISAPLIPLSIPSRTRDGDLGCGFGCDRFVGEALTSTCEGSKVGS